MISAINIIIALLWLQSAIVDFASFTYLWQLKEYRWDRFRDFISTVEGKNYFLSYRILWRSILALVIFFWPINVLLLKYFIITLFFLDFLDSLYHFFRGTLRRPRPTKKAVLIIFIALLFEAGLFLFKAEWTALVVLLIIRFFTLSIVVTLFKYPTELLKSYLIKKATKKIAHYDKLIVIGVTGSYGKSTVKSFLRQILSVKYNVVNTPKNINTEIGVANFILRTDFGGAEIFIVEMGAYSLGEIKKICDIVYPQIGILTAINAQHLSLFGSLKNTQKTKYELLRSLPKDGLAITNADNPYCVEFLSELKCQVQTFGVEEENKPNLLILESNVINNGIECVGRIGEQTYNLFAPIYGEYNILNIAPCALVALHLGIGQENIKAQTAKLQLPSDIFSIYNYGKAIIIDDSYNSNPNGFKCIISDVLNRYSSSYKRVVITRGMLELGEQSDRLHRQIGEEIAFVADELIIITKDSAKPLQEGALSKYHINVKTIFDSKQLLNYVRSLKEEKAVILLENRIPEIVHRELKQNKL